MLYRCSNCGYVTERNKRDQCRGCGSLTSPWFPILEADFDHEDRCPACDSRIEGLANAYGLERPSPGDVIVCMYCHTITTMGDDQRVRMCTEDEYRTFSADPDIQRILWAMRQLGPPPSRTHDDL